MARDVITIGFGGDLMIGRLVNDYLDHDPSFSIWGDLLPILKKNDLNLINLETALTKSNKKVSKVFNFKAAPEKVGQLLQGKIDVVNLANNHILDFSEEGLIETIETLDKAKILHVGAGLDLSRAKAPVIIEKEGMKIGILGCTDNEPTWCAGKEKAGTYFVEIGDLKALRHEIIALRKRVDLLILSIHWGPNMIRRPFPEHRKFAHQLIELGVDIIHGHSAHVFQGIEIFEKKVILYDTGDFIDDYAIDPLLRNDCSFFFLIEVDKKRVRRIRLIPTLISHFQVNISKEKETLEMMQLLSRELHMELEEKEGELFIELT
jgi:poly-gamma-glutamate capsule biosynthesis protein CapA/YwtB (metallophosphatase superfamily)